MLERVTVGVCKVSNPPRSRSGRLALAVANEKPWRLRAKSVTLMTMLLNDGKVSEAEPMVTKVSNAGVSVRVLAVSEILPNRPRVNVSAVSFNWPGLSTLAKSKLPLRLVKVEVTATLPGNKLIAPTLIVIEPLISGVRLLFTLKPTPAIVTLANDMKSPILIFSPVTEKSPSSKPFWVRSNFGNVKFGKPVKKPNERSTLGTLNIVNWPGFKFTSPKRIVSPSPSGMLRFGICRLIKPGTGSASVPKSKLPESEPRCRFNNGMLGNSTTASAVKETEPLITGVGPYCRLKLLKVTETLSTVRISPPMVIGWVLLQLRLPSEKPSRRISRFETASVPSPLNFGELRVAEAIVTNTAWPGDSTTSVPPVVRSNASPIARLNPETVRLKRPVALTPSKFAKL